MTVMADAAERARALEPQHSFIVQAPAGAGKTSLLVQRYLALLPTVTAPEQILALTFTRKAAAEMRARVFEALASITDPEPDSAHEQTTRRLAERAMATDAARGWRIRENPARLRVQTIDALAADLARQLPVLAGLGAAPSVIENAAELYLEAARRVLRLDDGHPASAAVDGTLAHLGHRPDRFVTLLAELLPHRDQWLRHLDTAIAEDEVRRLLEHTLEIVVCEALVAARAALPPALAGEIAALARLAGAYLGHETLAGLLALPATASSDLPAWQALATWLLTRSGRWRMRPDQRMGFPSDRREAAAVENKRRMTALLRALEPHPEAATALALVGALPRPHYSLEQWTALRGLVAVLPTAVTELRRVFRAAGVVDFVEVTRAARAALGNDDEPTDLLLALDHSVRHLLVDEFQDTSRSQWALLRQLTSGWERDDGRTVFFVGDPMQSIYAFREADVRLFLRAQHGDASMLGTLTITPLRLCTNFRSTPAIVDWVNTTFARVFPAEVDLAAGAVSFDPAVAAMGAGAMPEGRAIHIHSMPADDRSAEAATVAELVGRIQRTQRDATIGVLGRTRDHLAPIVRALTADRNPFRAEKLDLLATRPVVLDLVALTCALLRSTDRVAWLACLRAPWCGLVLADLHTLAGDADSSTCWELLQDPARRARLSDDGRARCERFLAALAPALAATGRRRLRDLVEATWTTLGGPACIDDGAMNDADDFLDYLSSLERGWTIASPEQIEDGLVRLFARPDPSAAERVQVMTMHQAKGLEFDIVILPELGRTIREQRTPLLTWREHDAGLLLAPLGAEDADSDPLYKMVQRLNVEATRHEAGRVLYVAATRARRELHLFGHVGSAGQPRPGSMLADLWSSIGADFATIPSHRDEAPRPPAPLALPPRLRRLPLAWTPPAAPPSLTSTETTFAADQDARISFRWAGETARHVGVVAHDLLSRIAREGVAPWGEDRMTRLHPSICAALAARGVPLHQIETAAAQVMTIAVTTLAAERGRWILAAHTAAESELELTGLVDGRVVRARIDRTFVDEHNIRWIVDFKTGIHQGGDIGAFLAEEQERYRIEMRRYGILVAALDAANGHERPIRCGLYYPLVAGGWREWRHESQPARSGP